MLAARFLFLSLVVCVTILPDAGAQERMGRIRQMFQPHCGCQGGCRNCTHQPDCSCQNCGSNAAIQSIDPATGGLSWVEANPQPWRAQPSISDQPMVTDPTVVPPPGVEPVPAPPGALDSAIPPVVAPNNAGAPTSGQDSGERFDLSSQFAGRGEVSGIRDMTIGDFFSGSGAYIVNGITGTIPLAGGDRRRKISDHYAPIPVNRTYFSYHGFGDAVLDANGNQVDVQRYTFALEKTFMQQNASFEIRLPFTNGLDSTQIQDMSTAGQTAVQLGNVTFATKLLLRRTSNFAWSAGMSSIIPTAEDAEIFTNSGDLIVQNEAFDMIPFMSFHFIPNQCSWVTLTTQLDFNVKGNEIISDPGTSFEASNRFNDQNLFGLDLSMGRWFWTNPNVCSRLRAAALIYELHYTSTITNTDDIDTGTFQITNPFNRQDTLNSTIGLRFQLGKRSIATIAGVFPMRGGEDRPFENEFNFNLSRFY